MPATLTPIFCGCSRLIGYEIRAGASHHSAEARDPYEVSGLVRRDGDDWIIGPLSGALYPGFVAELRAALRRSGVRAVKWERAGGKHTTETVEKGGEDA